MIRTAFFGGSFNPPHRGHLGVAQGALRSGRTDRVCFAPAFAPPHKPGRPLAPFADRAEMVRLLIRNEQSMFVSDIENRLQKNPSYSIDILAALEQKLGEPVQLLIGGDSLRDFHTWHRAPEILERHEVLTYPRAGETPTREELLRFWSRENTEKLLAGVLPGDFFEISSTNIRKSMAKETNPVHINIGDITPEVEAYIRNHNLYTRSDRP